ncbi:Fic family protein [Patescibacteria group bacterium]|nr:Fic family protein [Patescibacteria group bacterium]
MINFKKLTVKKQELDKYRPLPPELEKNLDDWFRIELTYTSNAIEGNTLSRQETAQIVEKDITVEGKTLREHIEAKNTAEAYDFIKTIVNKKKIAENDILDIHRIVLQKIDDRNAGKYRNIAVRIAGSEVILPNSMKVPELMGEFAAWLNQAKEHPVKIALDAHFKLVSIHPFTDGNGRAARLLMNLVLLINGYIPIFIKKEDRRKYISAIEKGQLTGDLDDYYEFLCLAEEKAVDIYLDAVKNKVK